MSLQIILWAVIYYCCKVLTWLHLIHKTKHWHFMVCEWGTGGRERVISRQLAKLDQYKPLPAWFASTIQKGRRAMKRSLTIPVICASFGSVPGSELVSVVEELIRVSGCICPPPRKLDPLICTYNCWSLSRNGVYYWESIVRRHRVRNMLESGA